VMCVGPNLPPDAVAGEDQTIVDLDGSGYEDVTLDGSASIDIDGQIVSWTWSVNGVAFGMGETLSVSAPVGVFTVSLTVEDDEGATSTDDVEINVVATDANLRPTADAGPNLPVLDADDNGFETVTLDGSASTDADGTIVSWDWTDGVDDWTGETVDVDFPVGIHSVLLTVTDDEGEMDTDGVTVTVVPTDGNLPPIADAGPDQRWVDDNFSFDTPVLLDGSGSTDPDGTIVSWTWVLTGAEIADTEREIVQVMAGINWIQLTVQDDLGATDIDTVQVIVEVPTLTGVSMFESTDFGGEGILIRANTNDLGADGLRGPCADDWNNCVSSIRLDDGWSAILYESAGFEGDSLLVVDSSVDLGDLDWDNRTSSIKVQAPY